MLINGRNAFRCRVICVLKDHRLPFYQDFSFIWLMYTGNHLDQSTFTRAVFTHERMYFSGLQLELYIIQRHHTRKSFHNIS